MSKPADPPENPGSPYWSHFLRDKGWKHSHRMIVKLPFIITAYVILVITIGAWMFETGWGMSHTLWSGTAVVSTCDPRKEGTFLYSVTTYRCYAEVTEDGYESANPHPVTSLHDISNQTLRVDKREYGPESGRKGAAMMVPADHPRPDYWISRNWLLAHGSFVFATLGYILWIMLVISGAFDSNTFAPPKKKEYEK